MRKTGIENMRKFSPQRYFKILATKYYLMFLQEHFGSINLSQLEKEITGSKGKNYFYRYMKSRPIHRNQALIELIDLKVPGSAQILENPLWSILANSEATLVEVHQYMMQLPLELQNMLFKSDEHSLRLIRKSHEDPCVLSKIVMLGDLNALAATLLILREMEIQERLDPYIDAKWGVFHCLQFLSLTFPFYYMSESIYGYIHDNFIAKNSLFDKQCPSEPCVRKYFAKNYRAPVKEDYFIRRVGMNSAILYHAEIRGIISEDPKEQRKFLYLTMIGHDAREIEKQLKALPYKMPHSALISDMPYPLKNVISRTRKNGRHRIRQRYNYVN